VNPKTFRSDGGDPPSRDFVSIHSRRTIFEDQRAFAEVAKDAVETYVLRDADYRARAMQSRKGRSLYGETG
jgi:hypothetical protein